MVLKLGLLFLLNSAQATLNITSTNDSFPQSEHGSKYLTPLIISRIADLTDKKTSALIGMANKEFNIITKQKNKKNRLLLLKEHCGLKNYLQLTSSGLYLLYNSIYTITSPTYELIDILKKETRCNYALITNIDDISNRLSQLTIRLPSLWLTKSPEVDSATDSYFESLKALMKHKSSFKKVTVITAADWGPNYVRWAPRYMYGTLEKKLLKFLLALKIDELILRSKLRYPNLLVNPTLKKLSAENEFYNQIDNLSGLPKLESIVIPSLFQSQTSMLKIIQSANIKELSIPKNLVSEALSEKCSIEKLVIFDFFPLNDRDNINAFLATSKPLKGLSIGWNACPSISDMSPILQKLKPSLEALDVKLQIFSEQTLWVRLLRLVLLRNNVLKNLSVNLKGDGEFNFSFLEEAVNLESFSYRGVQPSEIVAESLFDFVSSHSSLKTLTLEIFSVKLVASIQANPVIECVLFVHHVDISEYKSFMTLFAGKTEALVGRGLIINSIPVENIVADLGRGLEDGMHWKAQDKRIRLGIV